MNTLDTREIQHRYDGAIGKQHLQGEFFRETILGVGRLRRKIFSKASGNILDVACGGGENFRHIQRPGNTYTAIELSPYMLGQAKKRAQQLGMNIDLRVMDAQNLEFPDATFDTVISALATCTFPDPVRALEEMRRVCKPTGRILLLEHGHSSWKGLNRWLDRAAPAQYAEAGCRLNQDPRKVVQDAGLKLLSIERRLLGVAYLMEVT
jgi:ubiquinone/menaquinone biosynthesis C-methylase UbiE